VIPEEGQSRAGYVVLAEGIGGPLEANRAELLGNVPGGPVEQKNGQERLLYVRWHIYRIIRNNYWTREWRNIGS
jgi:hypothetical protein